MNKQVSEQKKNINNSSAKEAHAQSENAFFYFFCSRIIYVGLHL